ncbi:MAG: hypothetical protein WBH08_13240, partial [Methanothrix sp.]
IPKHFSHYDINMLCRLMSLLVYKYGLYPAFEKAGISPDFVLNPHPEQSLLQPEQLIEQKC